MKSTISVYDSHEKAFEAVGKLKEAGFPVSQLSVLGQAEMVDNHMHTKPVKKRNALGVAIGAVVGPVLGVLTGVGLFAIPGLGFLFGAGAIVGAIAGFDIGLIGGGAATIFSMLGVKEEHTEKYKEHLNEGKFLLIAQGSEKELEQAKDILHAHGTHEHLEIH